MSSKNVLVSFLTIMMVSMLTSCGQWYYCTVSGFGSKPLEMTYYIEPIDSNLNDNLEFHEYANMLKERLNETGYKDTNPEVAALCIRFGQFIGDKEFAGTNTLSGGFSLANGNITSNTKANVSGNATTNVYDNRATTTVRANGSSSTKINTQQRTNTFNYSRTTAEYVSDIGCYIEAIETRNWKPIWSVEVKDYLRDNQSFRKVMPWMIASAQTYFGQNGEGVVKITEKEGRKQKGLVWPY